MKRTYLFGTMMAFGLAVASVGAQQDRPTASSGDQQGKNVVVTGCLRSGSQLAGSAASGTAGTTGTTGTSGTTAGASSSFILADAKVAPVTGAASATATAGSTAGTAGTSGTTSATTPSAGADKDKAKSFALVGGTATELQGYINSKVEVTGTIDPSASGSTVTGSPTTATGSPTTTGSTPSMAGMSHAGDPAKLRVTSVRQVAASCDPVQR